MKLIDKKWSAMMITIFIVLFLTLIMVYFIEKVVPMSRNIVGIENSNMAYYQGQTAIEEALLFMNSDTPRSESWATVTTWNKSYSFQITASGTTIPFLWNWNSIYNSDWNRIWPWEPIQLMIPDWIDWSAVNFYFKVPNLNNWWDAITLSWWITLPIINWILSWSGKSLIASWSQITAATSEIFPSNSSWTINLASKNWIDLNWSWWTFVQFYDANSPFNATSWLWNECTNYQCTLKLSIINQLVSTSWEAIPYLEYKIIWLDQSIPLQYATINANWISYWFKRNVKREIRQLTTNEALDFTVFQ